MKLLLDTHIWIWSLLEPQKLPKRLARELRSSKNELWLSPISVWETQLLIEAKRIRIVKTDATHWVAQALRQMPLNEAQLTHAVAIESRQVLLPHHDPADRFLAATAKVYDLVLATVDERILAGKGFRTLGN